MATAAELQIVRDYVNAAIAADPVNWVNTVTQRMDELGVSPAVLQQAFPEVSLADIQAAYNQARPTGVFAPQPTVTPAPVAPAPVRISPSQFNPAGTLTLTGAPPPLTTFPTVTPAPIAPAPVLNTSNTIRITPPAVTPAPVVPPAVPPAVTPAPVVPAPVVPAPVIPPPPPAIPEAGTVSTLGTTTGASTSRLSPDQISIVQDFVNAAMQNNPENWVGDVTRRMDEVGLSPDMLQQVYPNLSLQQIQQAYNQSRPSGMFATPDATPDPLARAAGESRIDPVIAPYLSEALGQARSLFLTGQQPQLYPGQMFVSPSAETLSALEQQTGLAEAAAPFFQQAAAGLDIGQRGLQRTALGGFLEGSPYRDALIGAATRPITQQFTEQVMPGIQSTFSQAGRLGSGAQAAVTGRATEGYTRALGDVTSQIAAADYARERGFQEAALRGVIQPSSQIGNIFTQFLAPSQALAGVGAQREAIAAQPLQESIQRFEYAQNLPQQQFANYMAAIYGSPLGGATAAPQVQGNTTLQNLGAAFNVASAIPSAVQGVQTGLNFLGNLKF